MTTSTRRPGARDRVLDAATRLFAADGIRAVGVDRVCVEAGVSKRSLYQHFGGKDGLVAAVLRSRADAFTAEFAAGGRTARQRITDLFDAQAGAARGEPHIGCPFVSAATELKQPEHPGAQLARAQKVALTAYLAQAAREAGATEADELAEQLTLVFDGASAWSVVRGDACDATRAAVELLLGAHGLGVPVEVAEPTLP